MHSLLTMATPAWLRAAGLAAALLLAAAPASAQVASLPCVHPADNSAFDVVGDLNGSGAVNVADSLCALLVSLWQAGGGEGAAPACVAGSPWRADLNCDGVVTVGDIVNTIRLALGLGLDAALDSHDRGCADACVPECGAPLGAFCFIDGQCAADGALSEAHGCMRCGPDDSLTSWTPAADGTPCDTDADGCTLEACEGGSCAAQTGEPCDDGVACTLDECTSLSPVSHGCAHPPAPGWCVLDTQCVAAGTLDPDDVCAICDPAQDPTAWSPSPDTCGTMAYLELHNPSLTPLEGVAVRVDATPMVSAHGTSFVLQDGGGPVPYCFEGPSGACGPAATGAGTTWIWVRAPLIPAGSRATFEVQLSAGPAGSAGDEVFDLYDDFEGSSVDSATWDVVTTSGQAWLDAGRLHIGAANGTNQVVGLRAKAAPVDDDLILVARVEIGSTGVDADPGVLLVPPGWLNRLSPAPYSQITSGWVSDDEVPQQYTISDGGSTHFDPHAVVRGQGPFVVSVEVSSALGVRSCQTINAQCTGYRARSEGAALPFVGAVAYEGPPLWFDWVRAHRLPPQPVQSQWLELPRSCLGWHQLGEQADGTYTIDPDGPGGIAPLEVSCDMTRLGGGWTQLGPHLASIAVNKGTASWSGATIVGTGQGFNCGINPRQYTLNGVPVPYAEHYVLLTRSTSILQCSRLIGSHSAQGWYDPPFNGTFTSSNTCAWDDGVWAHACCTATHMAGLKLHWLMTRFDPQGPLGYDTQCATNDNGGFTMQWFVR